MLKLVDKCTGCRWGKWLVASGGWGQMAAGEGQNAGCRRQGKGSRKETVAGNSISCM